MNINPTLIARDIAKHVESLLPPLDATLGELATAERAGAEGLGPTVTLPAVYVVIILKAWESETLERQLADMEDRIAQAEMRPTEELSDDELSALAILLAEEAIARSSEPAEGAAALWKAAAIAFVSTMQRVPGEILLSMLDEVHAATRADIAQAVGHGAVKQ